jgi:5-methylcytosine-specific restriction endonuclease McrA
MALFKLETKFFVVDISPDADASHAADSWPLQPGDIGQVHIDSPIGSDHQGIDRKVVIVEDDCTPKVDRSRQVIVRFLDELDGYEHLFHRWRIRPNGPSPVIKEPSPVEGLQTVQGPGKFGFQSRDVFVPTFTRDEQHAMALQLTLTFKEAKRSRGSSIDHVMAALNANDLERVSPAGTERRFWVFRDRIYSTTEQFTPEEVTALIVDVENRKKARIGRALNKAAQRSPASSERRLPIPDDVKMFLWQRDGGRCIKCESNRNLEFDHIIPVALGGSNTARNIQLLCEECNRAKGASLV